MRDWRSPAQAACAMLAVAVSVLLLGQANVVDRVEAQSAKLQRYGMVDQWPPLGATKPGELWRPISLDVAPDGTVFISDPDAGGVHRMRSNGEFASMLGRKGGGDGPLVEAGPLAVAPAADSDDVRLYVIDAADERIAVYDLEGGLVDEWPNVVGSVAISADGNGMVFVADSFGGWLWAYDSEGRVPYVWGQPGSGPGEFERFTDISVLPSGEAIAVADKDGDRVQVFDLPPSGVRQPTLRHEFDLTETRYGDCRADVVNLLERGSVWVGQGDHACEVTVAGHEERIAPSALNDTICRETVSLPRVIEGSGQYYAIAVADPNPGKCGEKGTDAATSTIVVRYDDAELTTVLRIWPAVAKPDLEDVGLFAPSKISRAGDDLLMVQDEATYHRYFTTDGQLARGVIKEPLEAGRDPDRQWVPLVAASDVVGEPLIFHMYHHRVGQSWFNGYGIGRLKESQRYVAGEIAHFVEPTWMHVVTSDAASYSAPGAPRHLDNFDTGVPIDLVYNEATDEAVLLYAKRERRRAMEQDTRLRRVGVATGELASRGDTDVPQSLIVSNYADLDVAADGRLYALDAFADKVAVLGKRGDHVADIAVAADAIRVAIGPDDDMFVLRSSGAVERLDASGAVTARFDARPLPDSDPTTLTDLVVMDDGRVFVIDGQVGVVSVFAAAEDGASPIPDDGVCMVGGYKSAAPTQIAVGEPVTVTLEVEGRCGSGESPSDIMLVVPARRLDYDPFAGEIFRLFSAIDFSKHRVGIVLHHDHPRLHSPLVGDKDEFARKVVDADKVQWNDRRIRPWRLGPAVRLAHENLPTEPGRRRVILLFRPANSRDFSPWSEINAAYDDGVRVIEFGWGLYYAPDPDDFAGTVLQAQRMLVDRREPEHVAVDFDLRDVLGDTMRLVEGSVSPSATVSGREVRWSDLNLPPGRSVFALQVEPGTAGRHATNESAVATFVDGFGQTGRIEFPVPFVEVEPAPPTATPTTTAIPTPTADPTRHAPPRTVFVPVARRGAR